MYPIEDLLAHPGEFQEAVRQRAPYRPLYVKLKLFYGCNLRCQMCNHWRETRPAPLAEARLLALLDELAGLGCRKLHLSGGEPLLRACTAELVGHAAGLGLRVTLTTNGTLVEKDLARALVQAGLRGVNISIDSPQRKVHDQVRGVDGAFKLACKAVERFRRYAHKGKLSLRINTVVSRLNYATLAELPDLAQRLGADGINLIPVDDHCGEHLALHRADIARYNAEVAPRIAERGLALGLLHDAAEAYPYGRTPEDAGQARRGEYAFGWYRAHPCFAPWTHSLVDYDGRVYVCCMTRERMAPLGDLKTQSFAEVWGGAAYAAVRRAMFPPALKACRSCDDFLAPNQALLRLFEPPAEAVS